VGAHPFGPPRQYDVAADLYAIRDVVTSADVVHHHVSYTSWENFGLDLRNQWNVMHHHGTDYRTQPAMYNALDAERAALRLVSNLELLQYGEGLRYLPNPVPVAAYARLRDQTPRPRGTRLRIGHSPSKRSLKGTAEFLRVCARLDALVEPVLIEGASFQTSLIRKATCDLFFDSFWLGLQCSGLEAAAMGIPVIAGDPDCAREYTRRLGATPYTFAADEQALGSMVERLARDETYRAAEARRVQDYVTAYHDGAVVAQTYLEYLDDAIHWREALRLKAA